MENKNKILLTKQARRPACLIALALLCSCASLKTPERPELVPLEAPMEIGKYPVTISQTFKSKSRKDTVVQKVVWHYFKNPERSDFQELAQATHIQLTLDDENHITAALHKGDIPLRTEIVKGSLKNGYFRAKHHFTMKGLPPFYWKATSAKMQLGVGREGQLYIDSADETNGSILIMAAGTPGSTRTLTVPKYEKQKESGIQ